MPDQGQRTEKATKRKLDKARREGQFPSSREFLAALQFLTFAILLSAGGMRVLEPGSRDGTLLFRGRLPAAVESP